MRKSETATNPFYVVLIIAGVCFVMTAFAYFTMTLRDASPHSPASSGLMTFVARHGLTAMIAELVILAAATFGAIGTDEYWSRRARTRASEHTHETNSSTDPS